MVGGYAGRIIEIDLTERSFNVSPLDFEEARKYLGGSGLAARILYDRVGVHVHPLSPDNVLIFMTGPFAGTPVPTSGRHSVVSKSPLTGIWCESDSGGTWGQTLKRAGYDGIIVTGKASSPVYIYVSPNSIEIRDASHLWGKDTYETHDLLQAELGEQMVAASIGQAGEKLALIAGIINDGYEGRAAGRGGLGAVMGSKNLKSIAVIGDGRPPLADRRALIDDLQTVIPQIREATISSNKFGTGGGMVGTEASGDMPIKNWVQGSFTPEVKDISGQTMAETVLTSNYGCGACPIRCGRVIKVASGPYQTAEGGGPEYETLTSLGALCLNDNLESVCLGNELCNRYGLDTISTGAAIAFGMEAFEKGYITTGDTGGVRLTWGSPDAIMAMIHQMGRREGFGWLLGEGVMRAAEELGSMTSEFALHVKGMELPMHDPRAYSSVAVGYATSNRGACHLQASSHMWERAPQIYTAPLPDMPSEWFTDRFGTENKGKFVKECQDLMGVMDATRVCKFIMNGRVSIDDLARWATWVTGWEFTGQDLMEAGERLYNLKRMYNVRHGISRKDDTLPARILAWKRGTGGAAEFLPRLGEQLADYYEARGWTEEGIPSEETLTRLGLDFTVRHLPSRNANK